MGLLEKRESVFVLAAIAVTAFPERPLIALARAIGPLIELPILWFAAQGLHLEQHQRWWTDRVGIKAVRWPLTASKNGLPRQR